MAKPGLKFAQLWMATAALGIAAGSPSPVSAQTKEPIKIGVIAEIQSIAGAATPNAAVAIKKCANFRLAPAM